MNDGGALADHFAVDHRDDQMMTGFGKIGGEAVRAHRLVEHVVRHPIEEGHIAGFQPPDFEIHAVSSTSEMTSL